MKKLLSLCFRSGSAALVLAGSVLGITALTMVLPLPPQITPGELIPSDPDMNQNIHRIVSEAPPSTRIAFIGDSITHRWEFRPKYWESYFGCYDPVNLGVSGDRIGNTRWRVSQGVIDNARIDMFVVNIGANDFGMGKPSRLRRLPTSVEMVGGILSLIKEIHSHAPCSQILLVGILPRGEAGSQVRAIIADTNRRLACRAASSGFSFTDVGQKLLLPDGCFRPGVTLDNLHLCDEGYRLLGASLCPEIRKNLSPDD